MPTWISWSHLPKGLCLQKTSWKYLQCPFRYPKAIWNEIKNRNSQVDSYNMWGVTKIPWRRETLPTPVFWPRQFLGVYSPWGRKESDKIGWLNNNSNEVSPFVKQRNQQYLHDCVHVQVLIRVQLFAALWPVAPKILYPWNFSCKNIEMDCHFLLQGIFPTQGLNPGLLHFNISKSALAGGFFSAEPSGKQLITSLGYSKVLHLESGTWDVLTGDVNIQSCIIIAHMIMEWPCSQSRKKSLSKSS